MPVRWLKVRPERLETEASRHGTRDFLHAVVAGGALVAAADGVILSVEKRRLQDFIRETKALAMFDPADTEDAFATIAGRLERDFNRGRGEALQIIGRLRNDSSAARLCLRACCAIAAADGLFDEHETRAVADICLALGLDPEAFDL